MKPARERPAVRPHGVLVPRHIRRPWRVRWKGDRLVQQDRLAEPLHLPVRWHGKIGPAGTSKSSWKKPRGRSAGRGTHLNFHGPLSDCTRAMEKPGANRRIRAVEGTKDACIGSAYRLATVMSSHGSSAGRRLLLAPTLRRRAAARARDGEPAGRAHRHPRDHDVPHEPANRRDPPSRRAPV